MAPGILVTGADGFIGRRVVEFLIARKYRVRRCTRKVGRHSDFAIGEIGPHTDWTGAVEGIGTVIHLAGRAHVLNEKAQSPAKFRKVNVDGSLGLAREAAGAGVKRFIYISSIGVNGNRNSRPFSEADAPNPVEPYAISKLEAEQGLRKIANDNNMKMVVIRPPLVYGPGAPGNFGLLLRLVYTGMPLPFGAIHNRRSFVALDNLVDLILTCLDHPAAADQTFLVADGEDLSTTDLLYRLGKALNKPARLLPVPAKLLEIGAALLGKNDIARRLCDSLQVDISKSRKVLGWNPPVGVDDALRATARHYLELQKAVGRRSRAKGNSV